MSDADTKPARKFKWSKALLIGSLALNFLFIGLAAGSIAFSKHKHAKGAAFGPGALGPIMRALPDEHRAELRGVFKKRHKDFRNTRRNVSAASEAIFAAVTSDPFDRDAFVTAVQERERAVVGISQQSHQIFADILEKMSLEERVAFVERAKTMGPKGKKKKDH